MGPVAKSYLKFRDVETVARIHGCEVSQILAVLRAEHVPVVRSPLAGRKAPARIAPRVPGPEKKPGRPPGKGILFSPEQDRAVAAEYAAGLSIYALGKKWSVDPSTIGRAVRRAGGRLRAYAESNAPNLRALHAKAAALNPSQEAEAARRYAAGESSTVIGRSLGVSWHTVLRAVRKKGVEVRGRTRQLPLNEAAFDNVENSPEGAYHVGLLMADGCVCGNEVGLGLSGEDADHVRTLRSFLGSGHALTPTTNRSGHGKANGKPGLAFTVSSARLVAALLRYGVVPRKSLRAKVKILGGNRWFWCGAVCGDGYIHVNGRGYPVVGLTGSKYITHQFMAYARRFSPTLAVARPINTVWKGELVGASAVPVIRALFANSPFALPRKKAVADRILALFPQDPEHQETKRRGRRA